MSKQRCLPSFKKKSYNTSIGTRQKQEEIYMQEAPTASVGYTNFGKK
jgi:hypothetical protein